MDWKSARLIAVSALFAALLHADDHGAQAHPPASPAPEPPSAPAPEPSAAPASTPSPAEAKTMRLLREAALSLLKEGNSRFAHGRSQFPNLGPERRREVVRHGQAPLATVLACVDSQAPVELVFDRGLGDLLVVRSGGGIATESELASLEYGAISLGTPLLIVLGHTHCGALSAGAEGSPLPARFAALTKELKTGLAGAGQGHTGDLRGAAIRRQVQATLAGLLARSPEIRQRAEAGQLSVLGAVFDLESGLVEWLDHHPMSVASHPAEPPVTAATTNHGPKPEPSAGHAPTPAKVTDHHVEPETPHPAPAVAHDPDDDEAIELARTPNRHAPPPPAPQAAAPGHTEKATKPKPSPAKAAGEPLMFNAPITSSTPIGGLIRRPGEPAKKAH
jgi:carbonic anhydrase